MEHGDIKERSTVDARNNMDESQRHRAEPKQPDPKEYRPCDRNQNSHYH